MSRRFANNDAYLGDALSHIRDEDLAADVEAFREQCLPNVNCDRLKRAAIVGKHPKTYEDMSRGSWTGSTEGLVELDGEEKQALVAEHDSAMPERGMLVVIMAVSLAAFLQGHVQTSINGASLYREAIGLPSDSSTSTPSSLTSSGSDNSDFQISHSILYPSQPSENDWYLGVTNAAPFFGAALLGCWMALPFSDRFGRRGSMIVAASVVMVTSVLLAIVPVIGTTTPKWQILLAIRIINGIGMGIKAVNTPVLASETAVGYWRGTSILAWQLWANDENLALALILGAPVVPSIVLLCVLAVCPESPRYYLRRGPKYSPEKAYSIIKTLRRCELIAMRDIFLLHKSIQQEVELQYNKRMSLKEFIAFMRPKKYGVFRDFTKQLRELFIKRRNRNPLISSSIAALAQQLCGINILAFYSGIFFNIFANDKSTAMYFSIGFGFLNFAFALPAIRRIDTMGRRKWLLITLPLMALMLAAAALSFLTLYNTSITEAPKITCALVVLFLYRKCVPASTIDGGSLSIAQCTQYSIPLDLVRKPPELLVTAEMLIMLLGPIPFTLAAESLVSGMSSPGSLGLFSFFNIIAWALVFLFVEETRRISLEDLDFIYSVPKSKFWRFQLYEYLPWAVKGFALSPFRRCQSPSNEIDDEESVSGFRRRGPPPQLYKPPEYVDDQLDGSIYEIELETYDSDRDGISELVERGHNNIADDKDGQSDGTMPTLAMSEHRCAHHCGAHMSGRGQPCDRNTLISTKALTLPSA
ncbi:putative Major facilitator superfamily (MFS) profile domain-containing protein [Seiridium cardinale]